MCLRSKTMLPNAGKKRPGSGAGEAPGGLAAGADRLHRTRDASYGSRDLLLVHELRVHQQARHAGGEKDVHLWRGVERLAEPDARAAVDVSADGELAAVDVPQ